MMSHVRASQWCNGVLIATSMLAWIVGPRVQAQVLAARDTAPWTIMIYGGVDSSAESHLMPYLRSVAELSGKGQAAEIVLLIDRAPGHSDDEELLGGNFEDTRLFQLKNGKWMRRAGGKAFPQITLDSEFEANSGDARTLGKFIEFAKQQAPAEKYALIVFGHGECRSACPDMASPCVDSGEVEDPVFIAEMTEHLDHRHSIDLIWFDVCSFGAIENAYQLRPGAERFSAAVMMATSPISSPAPMGKIFQQTGMIGSIDGPELPPDATSFGTAAIHTIRDHIKQSGSRGDQWRESWGCYDLTTIDSVKRSMDQLAFQLARHDCQSVIEEIRGSGSAPTTMNYLHVGNKYRWLISAHFDLYDLVSRIHGNTTLHEDIRAAAQSAAEQVDRMVLASFGGKRYEGFTDGKHGVYIVFPDGGAEWKDTTHWSTFQWYHPDDQRTRKASFGNYDWCSDGATRNNQVVENWFELLDFWYDTNDAQGGLNRYRW